MLNNTVTVLSTASVNCTLAYMVGCLLEVLESPVLTHTTESQNSTAGHATVADNSFDLRVFVWVYSQQKLQLIGRANTLRQ